MSNDNSIKETMYMCCSFILYNNFKLSLWTNLLCTSLYTVPAAKLILFDQELHVIVNIHTITYLKEVVIG